MGTFGRALRIYFASQNKNKIREISSLVPGGIEILGIDAVTNEELSETGSTLEENAVQKARFVAEKTGVASFADDTGLEIDALGGAPGVISARYAGEQKNAGDNIRKVLEELRNVTDRRAQFRTVIAFEQNGESILFEGTVKGTISREMKGDSGFGYDPIFIPDGSTKTFAEMSLEEKNAWSHRARAVRAFIAYFSEEK